MKGFAVLGNHVPRSMRSRHVHDAPRPARPAAELPDVDSSCSRCLARFDLETPEHCIVRGDSWIFGPEATCERRGDVGHVTTVAMAAGSTTQLLDWMDRHGTEA